jgi:hypothetical protein
VADRRRSPPTPGSPEESAIIFRALAAGAGSSSSTLSARTGAIVATVVIVVVAVIGLVLAADHLRHDASNNDAGSAGAPSAAETNLNTALTAATTYETAHGGGLQGLTTAFLGQAEPALSFLGVSGSASQIAVALPSVGSLVLTALRPRPAACFGVLQVVSAQAVPLFSDYQGTSQPGTYYFVASASSGLCNALTVTPPTGGSYLSPAGWPTRPLP